MSAVSHRIPVAGTQTLAQGPTYAHRILDAFIRFGTRPALRWKESGEWQTLSFEELEGRVLACAVALRKRGVTRGDRVAIWLDNRLDWVICDLASQIIGAVTTTVYHTLIPSQAVALVQNAEAKALLSSQDRLAGMMAAGGPTEGIIVFSADEGSIGESFNAVLRESELAIMAQPEIRASLREPIVEPDDLSALFYTSGTTGEPKGVMLTHANVLVNTDNTVSQLMPSGGQTVMLHLPLAHVIARNTTLPAALLSGGVMAFAEPEREKLMQNLADIAPQAFPTVPHLLDKFMERAMEAIQSKGFVMRNLALWTLEHCRTRRLVAINGGGNPTAVQLGVIGSLLDRIVLQKIREKLGSNLEFIVTGGANSNRKSIEFFWGIGIPVFEGYGATELTCTAALTWSFGMKLGTVGQSVPGVEVMLAADGEVLVRGPIVMKGYWRRPEATAEAIDADGWYHTGDIGTLDADGYLAIIDRKREIMVLATGKNIAPQAIENTLKRTPLVLNVCAVGHRQRFTAALIVPDLVAVGRRLGLPEPPAIDSPRVAELLREELSRQMSDLSSFERIKRFVLVAEPFLPENGLVTPTLKLQRRKIAERFAAEIEDLYAETPKRAIGI
jgi:long-chain acyl-CoA synthetase